jgi:hypothetical protein
VNVRSGPGREFRQIDRFPGGCTVGFDGFCIGEPIPDFITNVPDDRWLLLHRRAGLVSSGKVQSQSRDENLGSRPAPECAQLGGDPLPPPAVLTAKPRRGGTVVLSATSKGASAMGFALYFATSPLNGMLPFTQLGIKTPIATGFSAKWSAAYSAQFLPGQQGDIDVVAAVCLASTVPESGSGTALAFHLNGASVEMAPEPPHLSPQVMDALSETACEGPP